MPHLTLLKFIHYFSEIKKFTVENFVLYFFPFPTNIYCCCSRSDDLKADKVQKKYEQNV